MAYNESLAQRLSDLIKGRKGFYPQKMFGGIGFLLNGNMSFGVYQDYLILRLGEDQASSALKKKHVKPFDITGRPMKGWVMVHIDGANGEKNLTNWIKGAISFVKTLPPKGRTSV